MVFVRYKLKADYLTIQAVNMSESGERIDYVVTILFDKTTLRGFVDFADILEVTPTNGKVTLFNARLHESDIPEVFDGINHAKAVYITDKLQYDIK